MLYSLYFISLKALIRKQIRRFLRIPTQTLLPSLITTTLYFIIFGQIIGNQLKQIHGVPYMTYISPGLIMMVIVTNSFANVSSSLYTMRFQRSIEQLLIAPIPNTLLLLGFTVGGMVRGLIIGTLVTGLALYFNPFYIAHPLVLLMIVPSTALLFSLTGFLNGLFAKNFDQISIVPTVILTPFTYLGGIFYPIEALPPLWQKVSLFNPFFYIVNGFRYAFLGISDISIFYAMSVIWLLCAFLISINVYLLHRGRGLIS